jgi:DNA-binding NtrC family response regulator
MTDGTDILILEDEMLIAMDIEATLQDAGFDHVRVCTTEEEVRGEMRARVPRIAMLDINLGRGRTSFAVAQELVDAGCAVVFMTGYSEATVSIPASLSSARRLSKPFDEPQLREALEAALDG